MKTLCKKEMFQYFFDPLERINIFGGKAEHDPSNYSFYSDLLEFYEENSKKVKKRISIREESEIWNFCIDYKGILKYENLCMFAVILASTLGIQLPDHIHTRLILGPSNKWSKEYVEYVSNLKPLLFGIFNPNRKNLMHSHLSSNGNLRKKVLK